MAVTTPNAVSVLVVVSRAMTSGVITATLLGLMLYFKANELIILVR